MVFNINSEFAGGGMPELLHDLVFGNEGISSGKKKPSKSEYGIAYAPVGSQSRTLGRSSAN